MTIATRLTAVSETSPQQEASTRLDSFMQVFLREQRRLYQFTVSLLANTVDADDAFQEMSLAIWNAFDQFQPGTDFYAWAKQIAYHRILRHWRENNRGVQYLDPDVMELVAAESVMPDNAEVPVDALLECVKALSQNDRHLIQRSYTENASGQQIADELHRPVNSIYKSLGRVRRTLMQCVERVLRVQRREGGQP